LRCSWALESFKISKIPPKNFQYFHIIVVKVCRVIVKSWLPIHCINEYFYLKA
jgi:hypothetical protein